MCTCRSDFIDFAAEVSADISALGPDDTAHATSGAPASVAAAHRIHGSHRGRQVPTGHSGQQAATTDTARRIHALPATARQCTLALPQRRAH